MVASVILAHPYKRSFNHAIFRTVVDSLRGRGVKTYGHDLYAENFDPVLTEAELGKEPTKDSRVKRLTEEMVESDLLVFIHPNWCGQPPAMMKGYIDRVFRPPYAYDYEETATGGGPPIEKLCGKTGIVFNTSNTPERRSWTISTIPWKTSGGGAFSGSAESPGIIGRCSGSWRTVWRNRGRGGSGRWRMFSAGTCQPRRDHEAARHTEDKPWSGRLLEQGVRAL